MNGVFFEESRILAYVTKSNKLCKYSQKLAEIFKAQKEKHVQFQLKQIKVDDKEIKIRHLAKELANIPLDKPVMFSFTYANNFVLDLEVVKRLVMNEKRKRFGYVLIDNTVITGYRTEASKEFKRYLFIYLDLLNMPIAYLDEDNNSYILSNALRELLRLEQNEITPFAIKDIMHPEDVFSYETRKMEDHKVNRLYFRLRCGDNYLWFSEDSGNFFGKKFILIRRVDPAATISKISFSNYKAMVRRVSELCDEKSRFAIAMLRFSNINDVTHKKGDEFGEILISKFFARIYNGKTNVLNNVFKISANEYALIFEDESYIDLIIRDLSNNSSELLHQDIRVNKVSIHVEAQVGLVLSEDFETLVPREIIKAGLDALKEATDPDFLNDYSIYIPTVEVEEEYDLSKLGINLEEDDLSEFLDELENQ
jgi:GGDEF domain-containing protein